MTSVVPAGFWLRLGAKLIDGVVFAILTAIVCGITGTILIFSKVGIHSPSLTLSALTPLLLWPYVICFIVGAWRHVWLLTSYKQATDGKRLFGIYVARGDGTAVTRLQALARFLSCYLPAILLLMFSEYSGMNMVTQFTEQNNPTEMRDTETLVKSYSAKIEAHQEPTTEERAAFAKTLEKLQAIAPSTSVAIFDTALRLSVIIYYIAIVGMVAFRGDKRGPHDLIAKTYVLRGRLAPPVQTPQGIFLFGTPGGAWRRLGAKLLNGIVFFLMFIIIDRFIMMHLYPYSIRREGMSMSLVVLAYAVYYMGWLISDKEATPEKRALNLYVVRADNGLRINWHQALLRFLASDFLVLSLPLINATTFILGQHFALLGILTAFDFFYFLVMLSMIARRKDKRGPHDFLAGTCVLHGKPNSSATTAASADAFSVAEKPKNNQKVLAIVLIGLLAFGYWAYSALHQAPINNDFAVRKVEKQQILAEVADTKAQAALMTPVGPLSITSVKPERVDNGGASTLEITGADFDRATAFQLIDPAKGILKAQTVYFENPGTVYATFDLTNKTLDSYSLEAIASDGTTAKRTGSLTVTAVAPPPAAPPHGGMNGALETYLTPPANPMPPNSIGSFTVTYINTGGHDMAAPILNVTSPNKTGLGFKPDRVRSGLYLAFLGVSATGPAGILRPGESGTRTLYFQNGATEGADNSLKLDVFLTDNTSPLNMEPYLLPRTRSDPNFPAIYANLQQRVGTTWGGYDAALARSATLLPPVMAMGDNSNLLTLIDLEAVKATASVSTSISGRINARDPLVPIAGQVIYAAASIGGQGVMTYSLNDGSFIFPEITPGTYELKYEGARSPETFKDTHPKAALLTSPKVNVTNGQVVTGITVDLVESVILNGQIISLSANAPVANANIKAIGSVNIPYNVKSDIGGKYDFTLPADTYTLIVDAAGYARTFMKNVVLTSADVTKGLAMAPESIITGTVNVASEPEGRIFTAMPPPLQVVATPAGVTDPEQTYSTFPRDNHFSLNGLPAGHYTIAISKPGYITAMVENVAVETGATTNVGTVDLILDPKLRNLPIE